MSAPPERLDDFMARANAAYYAERDPFADFTTSPEITQAFGEVLGAWAAVCWQLLGRPDPVILAEAGPGRGTLMADALRAIGQVAPDFLAALRVHLIETSPRLRAIQAENLPGRVAGWHDHLDTLPDAPLLLLANEFLDALPIRQFVRRGEFWTERFVGPAGFVEHPAGPLNSQAPDGEIPDGEIIENGGIIEIREPADWAPVDGALDRLAEFDWLIFTSANGVQGFMQRLLIRGDLRQLGRIKIAAVGPKTAAALRGLHLNPDVVPKETHSSEGLVELLGPAVAGKRVLLARANRGKETLPIELAKVCTVESVVVYEQHDALDTESEAFAALRRGEIEFITLSSSNIARSLLRSFDETLRGRVMRGDVKLIAISGETAAAIREFDLPVDAVATVASGDGLIRAVIDRAKAEPKGTD